MRIFVVVISAFIVTAGASVREAASGAPAFPTECAACHQLAATVGQAPALKGVLGSKMSVRYRARFPRSHGVWTEAALTSFLAQPHGASAGRAFSVTDANRRAEIVTYLRSPE